MDVQHHTDPQAFMALAEPFYAVDTLRHTTALTVMPRFLTEEQAFEPVMVTLHDDSRELIGVALRTPPWPIIVSGLPADPGQLDAFVVAWLSRDPEVPGVFGPRANAEAVADAWVKHTNGSVREVMAGRLFRLGELVPPITTGVGRVATEDDFDLLVRWRDEFQLEATGRIRSPAEGPASVRRMFAMGDHIVIWEDRGEPVSMAVATAPIRGMSRITPVYTSPGHRGRGYGSAVTAQVSARVRQAGARDVVLFTDLANPVSNSIYQKIGYRPVYDSAEFAFARLPSTT